MSIWVIFLIISITSIILEVINPKMLFINFAFAGIFVAIISIFWGNPYELAFIYIVLAFLSIQFLKPVLIKISMENKDTEKPEDVTSCMLDEQQAKEE